MKVGVRSDEWPGKYLLMFGDLVAPNDKDELYIPITVQRAARFDGDIDSAYVPRMSGEIMKDADQKPRFTLAGLAGERPSRELGIPNEYVQRSSRRSFFK